MRRPYLIVPMLMALSAGCSDGGTGFYASGSFMATVTDPNSMNPGHVTYNFPPQTRIDLNLPADASVGYTGSCSVGPNGRSVTITAVGQDTPSSIHITMPDWSQDTCTTCTHGQIDLTLQQTVFTGAENRGTGQPPACTFNATRDGDDGMMLTAQCAALASPGDPRSVSINANLTLTHCATH